MLKSSKYDYIIAGAGLAGLSLAYKIKSSSTLKDRTILLIDPSEKTKNDRTWCFWTKKEDAFNEIIYKKWKGISFHSDNISKSFDISPYAYKMIRGIDFYEYVIEFLKNSEGVDFLHEKIESIEPGINFQYVSTLSKKITSSIVFKSYYENKDFSNAHFVWQHFKGWIIKMENDTFNPDEAVFMDFRVNQDGETRFFYVLPFNEREALVEIAIFSEQIPASEFYDPFLKNYIKDYISSANYFISEVEVGAIPMTTYDFNKESVPGLIQIGTNGGSVKASSGYAFKRIQDETDRLLLFLEKDKVQEYLPRSSRYQFYDKILLNAILSHKTSGKKVFERLFSRLSPQTIFKFLDEKGSFLNDLKIFSAPPTLPFFKAFTEEIKKKFRKD